VREALPFAKEGGEEVEGLVLHTLAWIGMLRGRPIDAYVQRLGELRLTPIHESDVDHLVAQELLFRGEVDRARSLFRELMAISDQRGEGRFARVHYQLCGLEVRAGNTIAATQLLDELDESAGYRHTDATRDRYRALLAATCGLASDAEEISTAAIEACESAGYTWGRLDAVRARGLARLAAAEPARAVQDLRAVWEHTLREGIDNPGVFPVGPDLVEALMALQQLGEAEDVARRLGELAAEQDHPWGVPTAARCDALIRLARAGDDDSLRRLAEAAAAYRQLGLHFDAARTMLAMGRAARRLKKWRTARSSLEDAVRAFEKIGAAGWADQARSELARVGPRRRQPTGGGLTPAEGHVIRLAADGLSNKEIAQSLHVTVSTVEAHLKHVYAKLGVHTRAKATAEAARLGLLGAD
jgi:DNA-binding CsgD family transcriptional regulator